MLSNPLPNARCYSWTPVFPVLMAILLMSFAPLTDAIAQARLFIHPTLIMFSGAQRSETVHVVNQGNATGVFELGWVDFAMTPQGGLSAWDGTAPWSIQPFARFSPRRVTLSPGETQLVRVALRADSVAAGEYYSHLRVITINDDLNAPATASDTSETEAVRIDARTAIAIPVIWRNSNAVPQATIETVQFNPATEELVVELVRSGELSTRGYLHLIGATGDAGSRELMDPVPVVIYPSVERRIVTVPFRGEAAADSGIAMEVIYTPDMEITSSSPRYATYLITF